MAGQQISHDAVQKIISSSGLPGSSKNSLLDEVSKVVANADSEDDPLQDQKEKCLATAASFARLAVNRALKPFSLEPSRSWQLSETLSSALKDLVARNPSEAASLKVVCDGVTVVCDGVKGFFSGPSGIVMKRYEALVNMTHNQQRGLLSSMPPEILERIVKFAPAETAFDKRLMFARSLMACKSLYQTYKTIGEPISLSWAIGNFSNKDSAVVFGPGNGVEVLGRRWQIMVYPKGEGRGKDTHVSVFLYGTRSASANGQESNRTSVKIEVPLSVPAVCLPDFTREADFCKQQFFTAYASG